MKEGTKKEERVQGEDMKGYEGRKRETRRGRTRGKDVKEGRKKEREEVQGEDMKGCEG